MFSKAKLLRLSLLILFVCQSVLAEDSGAAVDDSSTITSPSNVQSQSSLGVPFPPPEDVFDSGNAPATAEDKALDSANDNAPQIYEAGKIWADGLEILIPDLLKMRGQVFDVADAHDEENIRQLGSREKGIEYTNFEITSEKIAVKRPGFGKMKLTVCDGVRMAVFKLESSGRKILIYEEGEIADGSSHLTKLIDTLKVKSDDFKGADVTRMVLRHDGSQVVTNHDKARSAWERKWWSEQWNGKWSTPDKNDYVVGAVFGSGLQAAATTAVMGLSIHFGMPDAHWSVAPILISAGFGGFLGVLGDSYNNWAYNGRLQPLKQLPNSILFSAAMMYFTGKGDQLASITFWATTTALILSSKTLSSAPWRNIHKVRSDLGLNAGRLRFSIFGQDFALSQRSMQRSLIYFAPFLIKNFDYFLRKYETIPFVDTWSKYVFPNIEHLPKLDALLHAQMPYFQIGGALLALGIYRIYLKYFLDQRPVSKAWPEHQADAVDEFLVKNTQSWAKALNVAGYPKLLKNFAARRANSISNGCGKAMASLRTRLYESNQQ